MAELTASNFKKIRPIEYNSFSGWQADSVTNKNADDLIKTPEKYLLSANDLYKAEGGLGGTALQVGILALGIGSIFASSSRMTQLMRMGAFTWQEWLCVGGTTVGANYLGTWASVNMLGNSTAYHNHWMAYYYVKSCNRWEGRMILKNKPIIY